MPRIFSFDFDGTLIDHGGEPEFHPALRERLLREKRKGGVFVINTGRSLRDTINGVASHGVMLLPDFIIARERDIYVRKGDAWKDFGSWNKTARKTHGLFLKEHKKLFLHFQDQIHKHTKAQFIQDEELDTGFVSSTEDEMTQIVTFLEEHRPRFPQLGWQRNGIYLRFMHISHSKGTALRELSRALGVPPKDIFAGGDNFNDLSMLSPEIAGNIACPGNAVADVRAHVLAHGGFAGSGKASLGMLEAIRHFFPEENGDSEPAL